MTAFAADWLNLLLRWSHLIAGIAWIGTSFYFIALDLSLRRDDDAPEEVAGAAWEVHGGGFYRVEKYAVAPPALPEHLTWFRWEAYLTWMTGFALLVVQFYLDAATWLIDREVMPLASWQAIVISVASLAAGWIVYDALCRSMIGANAAVLAVVVFVLIVAATFGYTQVFSARGALVHAGALTGTIMAFNVFAVIIPNQKKVVAVLLAGHAPDPRLGDVAKQRSMHNTYLTLPVLLLMVSGHYPMLTGHPHAWLLVALIIVGGGCARHFLVHHEVGTPFASIAWTLPVTAVALAVAVTLTAPASRDWERRAGARGERRRGAGDYRRPLRVVPRGAPGARRFQDRPEERGAGDHRRSAPLRRPDRSACGAYAHHAARKRDRHDRRRAFAPRRLARCAAAVSLPARRRGTGCEQSRDEPSTDRRPIEKWEKKTPWS